ncbi:MAG: hypothetical protein WC405_09270 [Syntrophales bacterium]
MKTLTYTDARHMVNGEQEFLCPLKPVTLLRRFQRYIETSDWDEQIMCKEHILNKVCMLGVILSCLALSPLLVAALSR